MRKDLYHVHRERTEILELAQFARRLPINALSVEIHRLPTAFVQGRLYVVPVVSEDLMLSSYVYYRARPPLGISLNHTKTKAVTRRNAKFNVVSGGKYEPSWES